jgi:hypothetical protein
LRAPLVFVYVRCSPPSAIGEPYYQRRLEAETIAGRRALEVALTAAEHANVSASAEILDGRPEEPLVELAQPRRSVGRTVVSRGRRSLVTEERETRCPAARVSRESAIPRGNTVR